jgi:hypothetical protein
MSELRVGLVASRNTEADDTAWVILEDRLEYAGIRAKGVRDEFYDPNYQEFRDEILSGHLAGIAIANWDYINDIWLPADDKVKKIAGITASARRPIFIQAHDDSEHLGLIEDATEIVVFGNDVEIIKRKLGG